VLLAYEAAEHETDPARRAALLTFVVIGAGPTGVELAGAIKEIAGETLPQDYRHIDTRTTRVVLFHGGDRVLPTFPPKLSAAAQRIQDLLASRGLPHQVVEFTETTRSAADAAAAIGCTVAQIAKSVIFRAKNANQPVLVIASGVNRVDEKKIEALLGDSVGRADADFVRAATGFAIGGVAPVGHSGPVRIFIDADLDQYDEIWAAAGSPNAVFRLTPADLRRVTGGTVAAIK